MAPLKCSFALLAILLLQNVCFSLRITKLSSSRSALRGDNVKLKPSLSSDSTQSSTLSLSATKIKDDVSMKEVENSSIALVAGTTIGAGVLALPSVSYEVGFLPSLGGLLIAWLIMCSSSLSIAEISANLAKQDAAAAAGPC